MNLLDAAYLPAAVLSAPWWARKARGGWRERFGHTAAIERRADGARRLLIHAVSVGEVNTLRGLVPLLRGAGVEVVVATTTDTGLARARALFAESALGRDEPGRPAVRVVRFALDLSASVRRFLDAVRPDAAALVELEVWPNFVRECGRRGVPVAVVNGRLSARSFKGYRRFRRFLAPSFARLRFVAAQDAAYAERFAAMGAGDVRITGSMKWDAVTPAAPGTALPEAEALARTLGIDRSRPLVVAGSTGPGAGARDESEESLLNRVCPPGAQLLCAPRRPERFDEAYGALGGAARCVRRSAPGARPDGPCDRFLLDTIGELRAAYALADVVVVGRTFGNLRGSDPIEPIALGKATVIGPDYANFTTIVEAFIAAGAIVVTPAAELGGVLRGLLADPARREALGAAGLRCIAEHKGATATHARMLLELLGGEDARGGPTRGVRSAGEGAVGAPEQIGQAANLRVVEAELEPADRAHGGA